MADVSEVVIGATAVVVATTMVRKVSTAPPHGTANKPPIGESIGKPLIFGFLLTLALLSIAFVAPNVAKGLAYLSLVGAFVVNGPALFTVLGRIGK